MHNFLNTIKNGTLCHPKDNENVMCDRCHKNNVKVYVNFLHNDLCLECVDIVIDWNEKNKKNINPMPLTRMNQNIFINNDDKILVRMRQDIFINKSVTSFAILEKISENEFRVLINDSVQIISPVKIANKYWTYLSESDRAYFIKYIT
jgi:hypothetical protein